MESLTSLNAFVQVAEHTSFRAAAQQLGISASAVGKSVARLEERIGVRLFRRSTRSVSLTPEGARFLERCRRILSEIEAAEDDFAQTVGRPSGKLRVSLPILGGPLIDVLADFQKRHSEVELDAVFTDHLVDLVEDGFDVVLRTGKIQDSRLTAKRLGAFRMMLVGSPEYFRERSEPRTVQDLAAHRGILFRYPGTTMIEPWRLGAEEGMPALGARTICSSAEARLSFALQGVGIAYLVDFIAREHVAAGRLVPVLEDQTRYSNTFHLLWSTGRHMPPKLRAFIDFVSDHPPTGDHDLEPAGPSLPGGFAYAAGSRSRPSR